MKDLKEQLIEHVNKPCKNCYKYDIGQKVRVLGKRSSDGQTPEYWDGALGIIVDRFHTLFSKTHFYKIRHIENNRICDFEEDELDRRYNRKNLNEKNK